MVLRPRVFLEENISFINCYFNMNNKKTKNNIIEITSNQTSMVSALKKISWWTFSSWPPGRKAQDKAVALQQEEQVLDHHRRGPCTLSPPGPHLLPPIINMSMVMNLNLKKSWWLPSDPEHWSDWQSHQGQGRLPRLSRQPPYLQPITFRLK